jgi:hypothetical protein
MGALQMISTPWRRICSISRSMTSRGRRNSGMPWFIMPPGLSCFSNTVTLCPISARLRAAARPAGPAPTTAIFLPVAGNHGSITTKSLRLEISGGPLGKTDGHRLAQAIPAMPAFALARTRAHAAQHGREHVVVQVDLVGRVVVALVDGAEVARDVGARGTGFLAGDVLLQPVEILGLVGQPAQLGHRAVAVRARRVQRPHIVRPAQILGARFHARRPAAASPPDSAAFTMASACRLA